MESEITGIKNSLISAKGMGRTRKCMDRESFKASVQRAIEGTKRSMDSFMKLNMSDSETFSTLQAKLGAYEKIAAEPIDTEAQFETVSWLFNGGLLREDWEIDKKVKEAEDLEMQEMVKKAYSTDKSFSTKQGFATFMWIIFPLGVLNFVAAIVTLDGLGEYFNLIDFISSFFVNVFTTACWFSIFFPIWIILGVIGAIIGINWSKELDESKGIKHDKGKDAAIAGAVTAASIGILVGCKGSRRGSHREI